MSVLAADPRTLRLYAPRAAVLDRTWTPLPAHKVR